MDDHVTVYGFSFNVQDSHQRDEIDLFHDIAALHRALSAAPLELVERIYDTLRLYHHRMPELQEIEDKAYRDILGEGRYRSYPLRVSSAAWCVRDRERAKEAARLN